MEPVWGEWFTPELTYDPKTETLSCVINDKDREVVERAAGEIDRAAAAFLPTLSPGEAAVVGVDFPIPLTVQIAKPPEIHWPKSEGPNFQKAWTAERVIPVVAPSASQPTPVVKEPEAIAEGDDEAVGRIPECEVADVHHSYQVRTPSTAYSATSAQPSNAIASPSPVICQTAIAIRNRAPM